LIDEQQCQHVQDDFDSFSAFLEEMLHHKVQKLSSGTGSPGWCRKKGCKTVVVMVVVSTRKTFFFSSALHSLSLFSSLVGAIIHKHMLGKWPKLTKMASKP